VKITCKEASRLISASQDKTLSLSERAALRLHLALCDACNNVRAQFDFLRRALREYAQRSDSEK
jgi:hypothetical protein